MRSSIKSLLIEATNALRFILMSVFDFFLLHFAKKKGKTKDGVVIIRLDAIGDFIIWLDAAKALKNKYGRDNITLILNKINYEIANLLPYWNNIIPINPVKFRKSFAYRYQIIKQLNKINCREVINTTYSRSYWIDDSVARHISAKAKIGVLGDFNNDPYWKLTFSNKWYTSLLKVENIRKSEHLRNAEILNCLGISHRPKVHLLSGKNFKHNKKYTFKNKYFVIFPGASNEKRKWEPEKYAQLTRLLLSNPGYNCIICGGSSDKETAEKIIILIDSKRVMNLTGETTLKDLISIIFNADFIVSNDTSAIHIAAATNTKGFCIVGGGHFNRFLPYKLNENEPNLMYPYAVYEKMDCFFCDWKCIYLKKNTKMKTYPCIENITVEKAFNEISDNLS